MLISEMSPPLVSPKTRLTCSLETFTEWSLKFKDEMKFEEKLAEKFRLMHMGKYTGREIFEKGLAKEEDE
jgi:hypothetical protein